jgi:hypothetical protein
MPCLANALFGQEHLMLLRKAISMRTAPDFLGFLTGSQAEPGNQCPEALPRLRK